MISVSHLYQDFSTFVALGTAVPQADADEIENAQLSGFESGYQAGWDDAVKAKSEESEKLTSDFVLSFQGLSFNYQEAYSKFTTGMKPLLTSVLTSVLPQVAREGLHAQLIDLIETLMDEQLDDAIELLVPPRHRKIIEGVLTDKFDVPISIVEEPALSPGQVYLRVNDDEREINTDAILSEVSAAVEAFLHTTHSEVKHG